MDNSHCGYIAKLQNVRPHPNADKLQLATVFGNQVIVPLDYKEGDIGVYFPTDLRLGVEFAEANNLVRKKDGTGGYLDPNKRHIRSIKLRGEFSDGLFLPLESLKKFTNINKLKVGDVVKEYNGITICEKYVPYGEHIQTQPKKKKSEFIQFEEHKDTKQLAYCLDEFKEGDLCYITHKLHGTSGRTTYTLREKELPLKWYERLLKRKPRVVREYAVATGTRRRVLDFDSGAIDFYGDNRFRKKYHDLLAPKLKKGETIYYEIVGYAAKDSPIMPVYDNKKINDEAFVKKYGDTTTFTYGCKNGENDIYAYRMTFTSEEGFVLEYSQADLEKRCKQMGIKVVPVLDKFIFTSKEDLLARVNKYQLAPDILDPTHINEGVVVRVERGLELKLYKFKNIYFKILEGIAKEDALQPDIEEMEG